MWDEAMPSCWNWYQVSIISPYVRRECLHHTTQPATYSDATCDGLRTTSTSTYGPRGSFTVSGPVSWNSLPSFFHDLFFTIWTILPSTKDISVLWGRRTRTIVTAAAVRYASNKFSNWNKLLKPITTTTVVDDVTYYVTHIIFNAS